MQNHNSLTTTTWEHYPAHLLKAYHTDEFIYNALDLTSDTKKATLTTI
jgi:hypothetical protein